jgi:hypothetical protein
MFLLLSYDPYIKRQGAMPNLRPVTNRQTWTGIVQSVQRLATGWKIRRSNPGGIQIFRTRPDRPCGPPRLLYNGYLVSFPGVNDEGMVLTAHHHLAPRLKKE